MTKLELTPYIKYVYALIACKYAPMSILESINNLPIPDTTKLKEEDLGQLIMQFQAGNLDYFKSDSMVPDPAWLREHDIAKFVAHTLKLEIVEGTDGILGSLDILNDSTMYEVLTSMALAKVNDQDIDLLVNGKYNVHYSSNDIKEFYNYFFCVDAWALNTKREYVTKILTDELHEKYTIALDGDKDYLLWKLGVAPDRSQAQMLQDMLADSYYFYKEKSAVSPEEARKWADMAVKLSDRLNKIEQETKSAKSLFDELHFSMNAVDTPKGSTLSEVTTTKKFKHLSELGQTHE